MEVSLTMEFQVVEGPVDLMVVVEEVPIQIVASGVVVWVPEVAREASLAPMAVRVRVTTNLSADQLVMPLAGPRLPIALFNLMHLVQRMEMHCCSHSSEDQVAEVGLAEATLQALEVAEGVVH